MYKYLFFDDQKLYRRENLKRCYGKPEIIESSIYHDGISSTDVRSPYVFKCDNGKFRMIYEGWLDGGKTHLCLTAVSEDGIHFTPDSTCGILDVENRRMDNQIFQINGELAQIIEDLHNSPEERYKLLMFEFGSNYNLHGVILTSSDLIHWKRIECEDWTGGAEPITGVFYNEQRECFTILRRPDWGTRRIGYIETKDWRTFTPYELCLQVDSLDEPLDELYGMPAIKYSNYYIGFPVIYRDFNMGNFSKVEGGTIESQLAYSIDGHHWQRSLRTPFLSGMDEETERIFGYKNYLCWYGCLRTDDKGDIIIYASMSGREHGPAFRELGMGRMCAYRLREDGFIYLSTENADKESVISTRENIWYSGELHINISCENATVAVYESSGEDVLGTGRAIEGYSHSDCIAFSGDNRDWTPEFRSGKTLDELKGKTLIFEIKFENGSIYSINGDCRPIMNLEGVRFRTYGILPPTRELL